MIYICNWGKEWTRLNYDIRGLDWIEHTQKLCEVTCFLFYYESSDCTNKMFNYRKTHHYHIDLLLKFHYSNLVSPEANISDNKSNQMKVLQMYVFYKHAVNWM